MAMRLRLRWVLPLLVIALWLTWQWWQNRPAIVELPVINRTGEPAMLEFYGAGLQDRARTTIAPRSEIKLPLTVIGSDEVRIGIATPRVQNDSVLLDDARQLQRQSLRFEIRPNSEFILVGSDSD